MFARAKGKQQRSFDSYTCTVRNSVLHILYYLSGLSRAHFADNLSRNSCIKGKKGKILDAFVNPIQTGRGGGGFSNPPSGKIVITPTPKEL